MAERQYLVVPYGERDAAKAAGARWDAKAKSWWVSDKVGRDRVERWLPERQAGRQEPRREPITEEEARRQFGDAMRELGLQVGGQHPVMDGKPHRVPVTDDHGGRESGRYVAYLDGHPAGHIKNYKSGIDTNWKSDGQLNPSADTAKTRADDARRHREREEARQAAFEATARRVSRQAERLVPLTAPTPYMVAKGIEPAIGALTDREGRTTYLPAIDVEGKQWTMQYIREDGSKRFAKDSRKEGAFHIVGGDMAALEAAPVLIYAEGYATAKDVADAARQPVVVAFDSGNLGPVAEALHGRFPDKPVLIAGDDDKRVELEKGFNPGRDKATDAAAAVGGAAIFPKFAPGEQEGDPRAFTDFNDLKMRSQLGREEVERQVVIGIELAIAARAIARETPAIAEEKTMAEDTPTDREPASAEAPAPATPAIASSAPKEAEAPPPPVAAEREPTATAPAPQLEHGGKDAPVLEETSPRDLLERENAIAPVIVEAARDREPAPAPASAPEKAPEGERTPGADRETPATGQADKAADRSVAVGDVPEEIAKRYYVQKSAWSGEPSYHETASSKEAAFRDQGGRIVAGNASPAIARDLVAIAEHRGWQPVQVSGTDEFKREVWLAASERGMDVRGYRPNERDLQELTRRREKEADRLGNAIAPADVGGDRAAPAARQPANDRQDRQERPVEPQSRAPAREEPPAPREYLAVPYKDRDAAKAAGARWDGEAKKWYASPDVDPAALSKWRASDRADDRNSKLIGADRNARAQMRVIETVVARTLADNPAAADRLLKEARSELASKVEQGSNIRKAEVRTRQPARSVAADGPSTPAARPPADRVPPPPQRTPPQRSRSR